VNHAEVMELLGAYALDAVEPDEAAQIEDHLRDCPRCRAELAQHREVASHLSYVGAPAPDAVWGRIAAELSPSGPRPAMPRLYPRRPPWVARTIGVAAALVAVAIGGLGWQLHDEQAKVHSIAAQMKVSRLTQLMTTASLDPSSTRVTLASADKRVKVSVVVGADGDGFLTSNDTLPPLADHRTYQLWGTTGDRTVSLGVLGGHPGVVAFPVPIGSLTAMALTAERAGGVVQTTNAPIAVGTVPRPVSG
jgi:hypothetical protein